MTRTQTATASTRTENSLLQTEAVVLLPRCLERMFGFHASSVSP